MSPKNSNDINKQLEDVKKSTPLRSRTLNLVLGLTVAGSLILPSGAVLAAEEDENEPNTIDIDVNTEWIGDVEKQDVHVDLYGTGKGEPVESTDIEADVGEHTFEKLQEKNSDTDSKINYSLESDDTEDNVTTVAGNQDKGFTVYGYDSEGVVPEGTVNFLYVDEDGKEIANRQVYSDDIGSKYSVVNKKINGYELVEDETVGEPEGNIEAGSSDVIFTYKKVNDEAPEAEGVVEVYYQDMDGNDIARPDTHSDVIGSKYEIDRKDITGYDYVEAEGTVNAKGEYEEGINKIIFKYEVADDFDANAPVLGGLVVKFVDQDGNEIMDRVTEQGQAEVLDKDGNVVHEAESYKTSVDFGNEALKGYGLVDVKGNTEGKFTRGITEVTYVFDSVKDDADASDYNDVIVKYVDEDGKELASQDRYHQKIGSDYETNMKKITGYTHSETIGDPKGTVGDQTTIVEYIYTKDSNDNEEATEGDVFVKYEDTDNNEIADTVTLSGKLGTEYESEQLDIDGYEFVEVKGDTTGEFTEEGTTITYVYEKAEEEAVETNVNVTYVDTDGNKVADPETLTGEVGTEYESKQKDIDGYDFVEVNGNKSGKFGEEDVDVEYVYEKVDGDKDNNGELDDLENDNESDDNDENGNNNESSNGNNDENESDDSSNKDDEVVDEEDNNSDNNSESNDESTSDRDDDSNDGDTSGTSNADDEESDTESSENELDGLENIDSNSNGTDGLSNANDDIDEDDAGIPSTLEESVTDGTNSTGGNPPMELEEDNDQKLEVQEEDVNKGEEVTEDEKEGKRVADTATNTFNLIAMGAGALVLAGGGLYFLNRRKKGLTDSDE